MPSITTPDFASQWLEVAKGLPEDAPDLLYEAQREKFFDEVVKPWSLQQGFGESEARSQFSKVATRPGKSQFPRAAVVGTKALEALTDPFLRGEGGPTKAREAAVKEAEKQQVGTFLPEMAGHVLGELPYWIPGLKAASVIGKSLQAERVAQVAAGSLIQGSYDAAKAPDGRALQEGLWGALVGGALTAPVEYAGPLWRSLRTLRPEVSEVQAKAVEAVAKGTADSAQQHLAEQIVTDYPELSNHVKSWVQHQVAQAKKLGVPDTPPEVEYHGRVKISVRSKEGKVFSAGGPKGLDPGNLPKVVDNVEKWLQQGASIQDIKGDPTAVHALLKQLENVKSNSGELQQPLVVKGQDPVTLKPLGKPAAAQAEAPAVVILPDPTPPSPTSELDKLRQISKSLSDLGRDTELLDLMIEKTEINPALMEAAQGEAGKLLEQAKKRAKGPQLPPPEEIVPKVDEAVEAALVERELGAIKEPEMVSLETGGKKRAPKLRTGGPPEKIDASKLDPASRFELRYDGKVKDIVDGRIYQDMPTALKAAGLEVRASKDNPLGRREFLKKSGGAVAGASGLGISPEQIAAVKASGSKEALAALSDIVLKNSLGRVPMDPVSVKFTDDLKYLIFKDDEGGAIATSFSHFMEGDAFSTIREVAADLTEGKKVPRSVVKGALDRLGNEPLDEVLRGSWSSSLDELPPRLSKDLIEQFPVLGDKVALRRAELEMDMAHALWGRDAESGSMPLADYSISDIDSQFLGTYREFERALKLGDLQGGMHPARLDDLTSKVRAERGKLKGSEAEKAELRVDQEMYELSKKTALTRTPLAIGEEGKSGLLMRYQQAGIAEPSSLPPFAAEGTVDRPLAQRTMLSDPSQTGFMGENWGAAAFVKEGTKPQIYYVRDATNKATVFHENLHGHVGYLGMTKLVSDLFEDKMGKTLFGAFSEPVRKAYQARGLWGEELFTYLSQAVRTNDNEFIQAFVDADGSRQEIMHYLDGKVNTILDELATKNDSIFKRRLEVKLRDLKLRSGSIADLEADVEKLGYSLFYDGEGFQLWDPREMSVKTFKTRQDLIGHIQEDFAPPLTAPELIDTSFLPEGLPRASHRSPVKGGSGLPPVQTDLSPVTLPQGGRIRSGWKPFSFLLRPREQWMESVARENDWPELYDTYREVIAAELEANKFAQLWETKLGDLLGDLTKNPERRKALGAYRHAKATKEAAEELGITPEEIVLSKRITEEITDPLFRELGVGDHAKYVEEYLPRLRANGWDPDKLKPSSKLSPEEIKFWAHMNRVGLLDPRDNDLGRVLGVYIQAGAKKKFMEEPLAKLAKLNNLKTEEGEFVAGNLQPLIGRTIEHFRGQPDFTYQVVNSAMNSMLDGFRGAIAKANKVLPESLRLEGFMEGKEGKDLLGKWMLMMYSGSMGLRPMAYIRDGIQMLMTTYPILGGKYTREGIKTIFSGAKAGQSSFIYQIPKAYGAIIEHSPLQDLYSATGQMEKGKVAEFAEWTMKPLKWSNNLNRLASFWGHQKKAFDAISSGGELDQVVKESGITWLPKQLKDKFVAELQAKPKDIDDFTYRLAKELTDMSQWNYSRGASPGAYKYAVGRLFGMYGTWPLNYIEYLRMLYSQGDKSEKIKAFARLGAAHYSVLAMGDVAGVDTATWVFSSPAAFGGSPIFNSIVNIPGSVDFETYNGDRARREVVKPVFPLSIPAGLTIQQLLELVANDDPDGWAKLFGFRPMKAGEADKGLHTLVP